MTTRKELETIKQKVLTALNNESVKRHRIQIKTLKDSDIVFLVSDLRIMEQTFFLDIADKSYVIHLMISYEDIIRIKDTSTLQVLYEKVN